LVSVKKEWMIWLLAVLCSPHVLQLISGVWADNVTYKCLLIYVSLHNAKIIRNQHKQLCCLIRLIRWPVWVSFCAGTVSGNIVSSDSHLRSGTKSNMFIEYSILHQFCNGMNTSQLGKVSNSEITCEVMWLEIIQLPDAFFWQLGEWCVHVTCDFLFMMCLHSGLATF
jgi:hypothetical protein